MRQQMHTASQLPILALRTLPVPPQAPTQLSLARSCTPVTRMNCNDPAEMQGSADHPSHHLSYAWLFISHAFFCTGAQQAASGSSPSHRGRLRRFEEELAANHINIKQLGRLAFHGIPEKEGLRATTWKVCCPNILSHSVLYCVPVHELMCALIDHVLTSKEA